MKRFLLTAFFVLISSLAFAQERIAIFPFEDRDNLYTMDQLDLYYREFSSEFKNKTDERRFTVISRVDIEKIIDMEHKFQLSRYSSKEITAEMERVLNPKQVLYILIVKVDNNIRINVSRLSFPEMEVLRGGRGVTITNKNQILEKIPELVQAMVSEIAGGGTPPQPNPAGNSTPAQPYKIGDTGPAGGIIFYDKGVFSGGWRYLEAAPAETEFTSEWGANGEDVANTSTAVGSGKRNTEIIVKRLRQLHEIGKAAQLCVSLNFDGYKDWFLPSKDELDLMYKNLKQKGLGGFSNDTYWSSSVNYDMYYRYYACEQKFSNGYQGEGGKKVTYSVRAVRAF